MWLAMSTTRTSATSSHTERRRRSKRLRRRDRKWRDDRVSLAALLSQAVLCPPSFPLCIFLPFFLSIIFVTFKHLLSPSLQRLVSLRLKWEGWRGWWPQCLSSEDMGLFSIKWTSFLYLSHTLSFSLFLTHYPWPPLFRYNRACMNVAAS